MRKDSILKLAREFAHSIHKDEIRKFSKEPYIEHPKRVAGGVFSTERKILAWLHDTVENSCYSVADVRLECHLTQDLAASLFALTRQKNEAYFNYIDRLSYDIDAALVKMSDLEDNMSDLPEGSLRDKYRFAFRFLEDTKQRRRRNV